MKSLKVIITLVLALSGAAVSGLGLEIDLSGTWVGTTYISDRGVDDEMTVVLKKDGDTYTGMLTDSLGLANETAFSSVELKDGVLTLHFNVFDGQTTTAVRAIVKIEGEFLVGRWETDAGVIGEIKLERRA